MTLILRRLLCGINDLAKYHFNNNNLENFDEPNTGLFCYLDIIFTLRVPRYSSVNDIREDSTRRQIFVENAIVLPKMTSRGIKMVKKQRCLMPAYGYATFENRTKHGSQ